MLLEHFWVALIQVPVSATFSVGVIHDVDPQKETLTALQVIYGLYYINIKSSLFFIQLYINRIRKL